MFYLRYLGHIILVELHTASTVSIAVSSCLMNEYVKFVIFCLTDHSQMWVTSGRVF